MKIIKSSCNSDILVDDDDYAYLCTFIWHITKNKRVNTQYAYTYSRSIRISMHRYIMAVHNPKVFVDHKNGNGLDNTKENLRLCSNAENMRNRRSWGKSKYLGVCYHSKNNNWCAKIRSNGKRTWLGSFKNEVDAAKAYNNAAVQMHGDFAKLNIFNL